jgi:hypothetical protein
MAHFLELIYDYRLLVARDRLPGVELGAADRVRLFGLKRMLTGESGGRDAREMPRPRFAAIVQFTVPGGFGAGKVLDISGGGMAVESRQLPDVGTRMLVRVVESHDGVEYAFPCRVVWRSRVRRRLGLAFDGAPTRTPYLAPPRGTWAKSVHFGMPEAVHATA